MPRDHARLKVFHMADELAVEVYQKTSSFPNREMFGITSQMRRSALSVPANIVEGCARKSLKEYLRFLDISYGSLAELGYYISLSRRLEFLNEKDFITLDDKRRQCSKAMYAMIESLAKGKIEA